jgi:hypothetical protein
MKKILVFIVIIVAFSCNNKDEKASSNTAPTLPTNEDTTSKIVTTPDTTKPKTIDYTPLWEMDMNGDGTAYEMKKRTSFIDSAITIEEAIAINNKKWKDVQLVFVKQVGETVFVDIPQSDYLTQRMGSLGPVEFFASTVYSLTEVKGVKNIDFKMQEGDHAGPGVYSRKDYKIKGTL